MPEPRPAIAAALMALFAFAAGAAADELPLPTQPWNDQGGGLETQFDVDTTTAPAVAVGTEDGVGAEPLQLNPEDIAVLTDTGDGEPEQARLPELDAGADMSECARDLLRSRLATTVVEDDILAAMALEAEILTLCRERQELVFVLYEVEGALAELRHADVEEADDTAAPVVSLLEQFVGPAVPAIETVEEEALPADEEPAAAPSVEEPRPVLAWFSILGVKGALRAGITDGQQIWWVTEGTELPGGVTVATITGSPPKVVLAGGDTAALPWVTRPGEP